MPRTQTVDSNVALVQLTLTLVLSSVLSLLLLTLSLSACTSRIMFPAPSHPLSYLPLSSSSSHTMHSGSNLAVSACYSPVSFSSPMAPSAPPFISLSISFPSLTFPSSSGEKVQEVTLPTPSLSPLPLHSTHIPSLSHLLPSLSMLLTSLHFLCRHL